MGVEIVRAVEARQMPTTPPHGASRMKRCIPDRSDSTPTLACRFSRTLIFLLPHMPADIDVCLAGAPLLAAPNAEAPAQRRCRPRGSAFSGGLAERGHAAVLRLLSALFFGISGFVGHLIEGA